MKSSKSGCVATRSARRRPDPPSSPRNPTPPPQPRAPSVSCFTDNALRDASEAKPPRGEAASAANVFASSAPPENASFGLGIQSTPRITDRLARCVLCSRWNSSSSRIKRNSLLGWPSSSSYTMSSSSRRQRGGRTRAHVTASVETSDASRTASRWDRSRRRRSSRSASSRFIAASFLASSSPRARASSSSSSIVRALSSRTDPMPVAAPWRRDRASNASMRLRAASFSPGVSARSAASDSRVCAFSPMDTSHRRTTATSARERLRFRLSAFVAVAFSASFRAFSATGSTVFRLLVMAFFESTPSFF